MKILRKIKIYHLTGKVNDPKVIKIINFFNKICNNLEECYSDKSPNSVFYKYDDKIYIELQKTKTLCRYRKFLIGLIGKDFGLNFMGIKKLTHYMLETYLKRKLPPVILADLSSQNCLYPIIAQ